MVCHCRGEGIFHTMMRIKWLMVIMIMHTKQTDIISSSVVYALAQ